MYLSTVKRYSEIYLFTVDADALIVYGSLRTATPETAVVSVLVGNVVRHYVYKVEALFRLVGIIYVARTEGAGEKGSVFYVHFSSHALFEPYKKRIEN